MKSSMKFGTAIGISVLGIGVAYFYFLGNNKDLDKRRLNEKLPKNQLFKKANEEMLQKEAAKPADKKIDVAAASLSESKPEKNHPLMEAYSYKIELNQARDLFKKVVLSADEKIEKNNLLANVSFLQSLKMFLTNSAQGNDEFQKMQNLAMDILLNTQDPDAKVAAIETMKAIIDDPQIESETVDVNTRKELAGLKGEVLYLLSAQDSAHHEWIEKALPGPVSQKIWRNVLYKQQNNVLESQSLVSK